MDTRTFHTEVLKEIFNYNLSKVDKYFSHLKDGSQREGAYYSEIYRTVNYPCYFYSYLACAVRVLKAKQAVEFGADMGVSALMMASEGAKVYSVDIYNGWELVPKGYDRIVKIVGASINQRLLKDVDLNQTDLWLFDAEHSDIAVSSEVNVYKSFFKPGSVLIFDDIDSYRGFWEALEFDKLESKDIHGGNVGIICVKN